MAPHEVVSHFQGIAAAARVLKVSPPSISQWINSGAIPIDRQCQIELVTNGALKADRDEFGIPVRRDVRSAASTIAGDAGGVREAM